MSTIEPRISITPSPTTGPLLRELSAASGKPVATIVRELLDEMAPAMPEMIEAFRLVKSRPDKAAAAIQRLGHKLQADLAQGQLELDAAMRRKPGRKKGGGSRTG